MMEFYSERKSIARKVHTCELCGGKISPGETYYRETGKWDGDFFSRALHAHCHFMEQDYCCEVDNEFSWDDITDYIADTYCCDYEARTDCQYRVTECPKIKTALMAKYGGEEL